MFSGSTEREIVEKLSETLVTLQKPQVYQIVDQWTQFLLKLLCTVGSMA